MSAPTCKCGEPHDNWPGKDGGELCQICWEAECDESWWAMVNSINKLLAPVQQSAGDAGEGNDVAS